KIEPGIQRRGARVGLAALCQSIRQGLFIKHQGKTGQQLATNFLESPVVVICTAVRQGHKKGAAPTIRAWHDTAAGNAHAMNQFIYALCQLLDLIFVTGTVVAADGKYQTDIQMHATFLGNAGGLAVLTDRIASQVELLQVITGWGRLDFMAVADGADLFELQVELIRQLAFQYLHEAYKRRHGRKAPDQ